MTLDLYAFDSRYPTPAHRAQGTVESGVSPWSGLKSDFLAAQSITDQVRIFDLTARTAQMLHRWAARYPLMRRVRAWPLALSAAAAAPFTDLDALTATARLDLWIFTLDDLFDEERVPEEQLLKRAERYLAIVCGEATPPTTNAPAHDSLAVALFEAREALARYPLFGALGRRWATAFCETIDAMSREHVWRREYREKGVVALPDYKTYMETSAQSISVPPHVWATMIVLGDASVLQRLDHLQRMAQIAARCIRLANDLRTYPKELTEGKVNALLILSHASRGPVAERGDALVPAQAYVRMQIDEALALLTSMRDENRTGTGRPEAAIADIARFACDFYANHDYHTLTSERR